MAYCRFFDYFTNNQLGGDLLFYLFTFWIIHPQAATYYCAYSATIISCRRYPAHYSRLKKAAICG